MTLVAPNSDRPEGAATAVPGEARGGGSRRRLPAVPVAMALAMGIAVDRLRPLAPQTWLLWAAGAWVTWFAITLLRWCVARSGLARSDRVRSGRANWATGGGDLLATVALLGSVGFAGGLWHHLCWSCVAPAAVVHYARETAAPVRLVGRVVERPVRLPARPSLDRGGRPQSDRTLCLIECRELWQGPQSTRVTGLARVEVVGVLAGIGAGDVVDVVGSLARPRGPGNPGGFDFRGFLRGQGVHVTVRCPEPEDVRLVASGRVFWRRWQGALRAGAEDLLRRRLSRETEPLGLALLLGTRTAIPEELRLAFTESGTMHILAISGANVGILAGLLWGLARLAGLGRFGSTALILGGVLGYSFLADAQPPVLRAVLMVLALVSGGAWHRRMPLANSLALAVLGVLAANPTHLFDTGAQLSFLAVAGLLWSPRLGVWVRQWQARRDRDALPLEPEGWTYALKRWCGRWLLQATLTLAAVWLFTLPLGMARFHLVSPVGFVANLLLAPLSVAVLWAGYLLLTVGLFLPWLGGMLGWVYDVGLRALMLVVQGSAAVPWGHFYSPGPSEGWLLGFYLLLAGLVWSRRSPVGEWLSTRGLMLWVVMGLGVSLRSPPAGELRCTFLSVGHGLAVLIDLPNGRRVAYDVGQMENGQAAAAAVRQQLWERGIPRIDCVILSHSDSDHYNGVPALVRTVPVGEVLMHSTYLDFSQPPVRDTCDRLAEAGVPIRLTWEGDQLWLDRAVRIEVLHPARGRTYPSDNAASLVLAIEYAGRRILLTGDVEKQGLQALLGQPPRRADVLLAPHHGSRVANPPRLGEWAEPGLVVVSGGPRDGRARLADAYGPGCEIVSTHDAGAITVRIDAGGRLTRETFRPLATAGDGPPQP